MATVVSAFAAIAGLLCAWGTAAELNVVDFGAIADDGLDDTTAVQAALSAAQAGDVVFIPAGKWQLSSSVRPNSGVALAGAGRDVTTISYAGSTPGRFIDITDRDGVEVRDITFDGEGNPAARQGIAGKDGSGHLFHNLRIQNLADSGTFGPHGIYLSSNVSNTVIRDSEFANIGVSSRWGGAIRMEHASNGNLVRDNTIQNTGRGGIFANASTGLTIRGNTVTGSGLAPNSPGLGVELWGGSHDSVVEDNHIDHWLSVDSSNRVAVRRNVITDSSGVVKFAGLESVSSVDGVFTSNIVDGGAHIGISISNDGLNEHQYWAHNTITRAETWGAQIQGDLGGARHMYFYDNWFGSANADQPNLYPDAGHGFRFNGNTQFLVLDRNRIIGNYDMGIQIGGDDVDQLSFINNIIANNKGEAIRDDFGGSAEFLGDDLEWSGNLLAGNGNDTPFVAKGFADNEKPHISISAPPKIFAGQVADFSFQFADDGSVGYVLWDFDHGLPVTQASPQHVFPDPGRYQISVVVWDDGGRAAHATLQIIAAVAGDYDGDGQVTMDDCDVWQNSFGSDSNLAADGNGNGVVDAADFTVWRDHLGDDVPQRSTADVAVPESQSVLLWALGFCISLAVYAARRINPWMCVSRRL